MNNLLIILPVFSLMLAGFLLGRTRIFPEGSGAAQSLSTYVWYVAIPALLIKLIANNTLPDSSELTWVVSYYVCLYLIYFVAYKIVAPLINIEPPGRAVFAFSVCFGNMGFIGIGIMYPLFGEEGVRSLLLIMSFHMLSLILVTTVLTEINKSTKVQLSSLLFELLGKLTRNTIIVTMVLSLLWSATGLGIADWVMRLVSLPADSAAPVGLFAVGLSLSRVKIKGVRLVAFSAMGLKLIALPLVVYLFMTHVMAFDPRDVIIATLCACLPTGVAAYNIAQQYDVGVKTSSAIILLGTITSAFTLTIAMSLLIHS